MSIRDSLTTVLALAVLGACTTKASNADTPTLGVAEGSTPSTRCAAVADSVRAFTPLDGLPLAIPRGGPSMPSPRDVVVGEIQTRFLVDPTGKAVRAFVTTTGTADSEYARQMEEVIMRTRFRPAIVAGCPSWSLGDFRLRREVRMR